jgi:hypothetical protein
MYSKCRAIFVYFLLFFGFVTHGVLYSELKVHKFSIKESMLPSDHPIKAQLDLIFKDPDLFSSPTTLRNNGFDVFKRINRGLMVISHPTVDGYLFKKFQSDKPERDQTKNFLQRINGARALAQFIRSNDLKHIEVPKKWLYKLPKSFSRSKSSSYILIVEKMNILPWGSSHDCELAKCYLNIQKDVLKELCLVLYDFRGLDSVIHNMPFTYDGKIAFVDTEKWEKKRGGFLNDATPYLSDEMQKYVRSVYHQLNNS